MKQTLPFYIVGIIGLIAIAIAVFSCKKNNASPNSNYANCPTTAACGCSAKNKGDCQASTDCCAWTTGQGCGCK